MGKCLVTKLNGNVSNSDMLRIGEMRITISKISSPNHWTQGFNINVNKETTLEIIGDGYFTDINLTANKGKKITLSPNVEQYVYVSNGNFDIAILNKYAIIKFVDYDTYSAGNSTYSQINKSISDISVFKYSTALTTLDLSNTQVSGNVGDLKTLTALTALDLSNTQVSGNVGDLKTLTALTALGLYNTQVSGNVGDLKTLTALTYLNLSNTQVSGNVGDLKTLTALTTLYLSNTQVSGNVGDLKTLTTLTYLDLSNTQVSGNVGDLKTLTALTVLDLSNTQVSGNVGDLKTLTALTALRLYNTQIPLTGDIGELSTLTKCTEMSFKYSKLTGDLATLPASCRFVSFKDDANSTLTWGTRPSSAKIVAIEGKVSLTNIDKMLQDQAQCQVGFLSSNDSWYKTISVAGNRTSASDSAVVALQTKGYTISITKA